LVVGLALIAAGLTIPIVYLQTQAARDADEAAKQLAAAQSVQLEDPNVVGADSENGDTDSASAIPQPTAIAKLRIPRFGSDWTRVVYEGTSVNNVLTPYGVGHYTKTALPGQLGNFALAAHRAGSGGPFRNIDKLVEGDLAVVETASLRFTYRFLQSKVVEPSAIGVIAPDPMGLTAIHSSDSLLTLTSCTPIHVNTQRYVAWFELVSAEAL
jgi:sortase A